MIENESENIDEIDLGSNMPNEMMESQTEPLSATLVQPNVDSEKPVLTPKQMMRSQVVEPSKPLNQND